jgi:hypothetical protein
MRETPDFFNFIITKAVDLPGVHDKLNLHIGLRVTVLLGL